MSETCRKTKDDKKHLIYWQTTTEPLETKHMNKPTGSKKVTGNERLITYRTCWRPTGRVSMQPNAKRQKKLVKKKTMFKISSYNENQITQSVHEYKLHKNLCIFAW